MPSGALYPSKSGLMNKHIMKHIVHSFISPVSRYPCNRKQRWLRIWVSRPCGSCRVNAFWGALYPSKSGPMNKYIVKHIVKQTYCETYRVTVKHFGALHASKSGLVHKRVWNISMEKQGANIVKHSVPCTRYPSWSGLSTQTYRETMEAGKRRWSVKG